MKKFTGFSVIFLIFFLFLAACNSSDSEEQEEAESNETEEESVDEEETEGEELGLENAEIVRPAETFIDHLSAGDYESATENFDATMEEQFSPTELEEVWVSVNEQLGGFIDYEFRAVEEADDFQVVLFTGVFNDADVTLQVTFNDEQQISGFYIV